MPSPVDAPVTLITGTRTGIGRELADVADEAPVKGVLSALQPTT